MEPRNHRVAAGVRAGLAVCIGLFVAAAHAQDFGVPVEPHSSIWANLGASIGWTLFWAALGAAFGAFYSDRLRRFRRMLGWVMLILGLVGFLFVAFFGSPFTRNPLVFIIAAVIAWVLLRDPDKAAAKKKARKLERDTTFGSAEWATLAHLQANKLVGEQGFFLGRFVEGVQAGSGDGNGGAGTVDVPLHYTGDRHLLTVAPTRSGKGTASIVPNLLTYKGSTLVIDPKGENTRITSARRGLGDAKLKIPGLGQQVYVVDPWGITGRPASRFNPLDWIASDPANSSENAMMLADSMITPPAGKTEPFWDEEAKALLMGFILFVALDPDEKGRRTLARVRDIVVSGGEQLRLVLATMEESDHPIVRSTAARTISKDEKLRAGVFASLQSHTHFLDSPAIRDSLSTSDFRFEDLKTQAMTVYLVLPADRLETFGRWLRLLVQQAITVNARNVDQKPPLPILFLLDEMAALGRLTMVEQAFGLMAGFGMQLWGIVQDLSQLERIYDKGWQTFIGNSGVLQYFGSRDLKTAEYFSKLCGVTTMEKWSIGTAIAWALSTTSGSSSTSSATGSSSTSSHSTTRGSTNTQSFTRDVVQRHLAYADELMVLKQGRQLVFVENCNPIRAERRPWFDNPALAALGVNLHPAAPATGEPRRVAPAPPAAPASPSGAGWLNPGFPGQASRSLQELIAPKNPASGEHG